MTETQENKKRHAVTAPIHNAGSVGLKQHPAFIKFQGGGQFQVLIPHCA